MVLFWADLGFKAYIGMPTDSNVCDDRSMRSGHGGFVRPSRARSRSSQDHDEALNGQTLSGLCRANRADEKGTLMAPTLETVKHRERRCVLEALSSRV